MNDQQIIELYLQRNETAIDVTQAKYRAYCQTIARHILSDPEDVEECLNDTWLNTWNAIPPQQPRQLSAFLAKITRNLAFNRFKAQTAQKRGGAEIVLVLEELEECLPSAVNVEADYQAKELREYIRKFVSSLSVRDGDVFVRRYVLTQPIADIAASYHLSAQHVVVILSRCRQKLKQALEREGLL